MPGTDPLPPPTAGDALDAGPVLAWGVPRLRDLPWRHTRDPWAILVAEVMLQQTQASRVVPRWQAFLAEHPDPSACASVPLGHVLRAWQGLGYPRRARDLHGAATAMVEHHGGRVPDDLDALMSLRGIGPYTARAVLAFAFERDVGVVDTNIARILARAGGRRLTARAAQAMADASVPEGAGWMWNQVLMDLGATVCRPVPGCDACPLASTCRWQAGGRVVADPAVGSAGVSARQAPYEGSLRQARGDVLRALAAGPAEVDRFAAAVVESLVRDGLVVVDGGRASLP